MSVCRSRLPGAAHPHDGLEADLPCEVARELARQRGRLPAAAGAEQRHVVHRARAELTHATCRGEEIKLLAQHNYTHIVLEISMSNQKQILF